MFDFILMSSVSLIISSLDGEKKHNPKLKFYYLLKCLQKIELWKSKSKIESMSKTTNAYCKLRIN